jgi:hypothetical protein
VRIAVPGDEEMGVEDVLGYDRYDGYVVPVVPEDP